jgi:pheromone a factor receptor
MAMLVLIVLIPYSLWILWLFASQLTEEFSWGYVHGPFWNTAIYSPVNGQVRVDKWGQVAGGYVAFFIFGTGTDAEETYKRMLCTIGLGKVFPSLNRGSKSSTSTPASFTYARGLCSTYASRAKSFFSKSGSVTETLPSTTHQSVSANNIILTTPRSGSFHCEHVSTNEPILQQHISLAQNSTKSFLHRVFLRHNAPSPIIPVYAKTPVYEGTNNTNSPTDTCSNGIASRVWAPGNPAATCPSGNDGRDGVLVQMEVYQKFREKNHQQKQRDTDLKT